jgi:predicted TIM-barrel fold metal-dependent hydrolase
MLLDDVAADFPELTIVMAHPAVPWVDSQIAIASHKTNVYIDLSGWSPKYFPPQLVHAANRQLRTKVLFGTDSPYITMDRWRRDFDALNIDPAVVPLIYKDNALRVLGVKT